MYVFCREIEFSQRNMNFDLIKKVLFISYFYLERERVVLINYYRLLHPGEWTALDPPRSCKNYENSSSKKKKIK